MKAQTLPFCSSAAAAASDQLNAFPEVNSALGRRSLRWVQVGEARVAIAEGNYSNAISLLQRYSDARCLQL